MKTSRTKTTMSKTTKDIDQVTARDLMKRDVVTLTPDLSVARAVEMFDEDHIGGAPVIDDVSRRVLGVLSIRDIARPDHIGGDGIQARAAGFSLEGALAGDSRVADWMSPDFVSVAPETTLRRICTLLRDEGIQRVFVTEEDRLLGIVTTTDIVHWLASERA